IDEAEKATREEASRRPLESEVPAPQAAPAVRAEALRRPSGSEAALPHAEEATQEEVLRQTTTKLDGFVMADVHPRQTDLLLVTRQARIQAGELGLTPFVYFYADWCPPCRALRASLSDPRMVDAFQGTYIVRLPADDWGNRAASAGFPFRAIPVLFRIDEQG